MQYAPNKHYAICTPLEYALCTISPPLKYTLCNISNTQISTVQYVHHLNMHYISTTKIYTMQYALCTMHIHSKSEQISGNLLLSTEKIAEKVCV